jgi:hypothetical protein
VGARSGKALGGDGSESGLFLTRPSSAVFGGWMQQAFVSRLVVLWIMGPQNIWGLLYGLRCLLRRRCGLVQLG